MLRFLWNEWNAAKVSAHGLSPEEVEHAFRYGVNLPRKRNDKRSETVGRTPSGRIIRIIWCFDEVFDALADDGVTSVVLVITAY